MIPYAILCLLPIVLGLGYTSYNETHKTEDRSKRLVIFCMWFALFFMIALRSKFVGSTDSYNYYEGWKELKRLSWAKVSAYSAFTGMELVFCYSVWILSKIFSSPQWMFAVTGLLFSVSVCRFIYKHSEDMFLSYVMFVTLGLYTFMIQGMRQAIAMSIILFAIDFCARRKFILFTVVVLLASAFHRTAIIFLPMYFIYGLTIRKSTVMLSFLGAGVIIACAPMVAQLGNQLFERDYSETFKSGGFIAVAIYVLIVLAALLFGARRYQDKNYAFYFFMTFIGAVFYIMRYVGVNVAERISYYFLFGQLYLLPAALNRLVKKDRWVVKCLVYVLCIGLFMYRINGSNLVPFKFFWQEG